MEKIHDRYKNKGFVLPSIYIQKSKKKIKSCTDKYKTHLKARLDENGSVTESFTVVGVPTLTLIKKRAK